MKWISLPVGPDPFNFFCSPSGIGGAPLKSYLYLYPLPGREVVHPPLAAGVPGATGADMDRAMGREGKHPKALE